MNRWWRAYDEAVNDPKLQLLNDALFRAWFNVMCIASKNDGVLPPNAEIAFTLRVKPEKAAELITKLHQAGLLDREEEGFAPHNWARRQFKSDGPDSASSTRQKRYRDNKRNALRNSDRNAYESGHVTVTAPREQITETEQKDSDADASDADAPIDHRKRLFGEGLATLARITGKGPDACRSFVGKCLKAASDDAVTVLGLIDDADRNKTVDPSAWIAARLKPQQGNPNGRRTVHDAANDLQARLAALDEPAPSGICGGASEGALRLLPPR